MEQEKEVKSVSDEIIEEMQEKFKSRLNENGELDPSLLKYALVYELFGARMDARFWKEEYERLVGVKAA